MLACLIIHLTTVGIEAYTGIHTVLANPKDLARIKNELKRGNASRVVLEAYNNALAAADSLLKNSDNDTWEFETGPWSVCNKTLSPLPIGATKHHYVSIGIYNHPCNNLPAGCRPYPNGLLTVFLYLIEQLR